MLKIFIDGASAGNPGPGGAGIFIKDANGPVESLIIPLGQCTNHEAEFSALLHALQWCESKEVPLVSINTDSKLVDEAVEKRHTKNNQFKLLLQDCITILDSHELWFVKWIPSSQNKAADKLSKQAVLRSSQIENG
ncbi:reverse transcriptase-like protein [Alteribacillus sp. HJP-4]|uniref:reverse transcriptase-like protein n=1 Tax=Alteribacillus sp. HJP-4 TaxID=2775394 RepID=UPI0035CD2552